MTDKERVMNEIEWLIERKESEPVRRVVDWRLLGLTDFPFNGSQPIHLQAVREKCHKGDYREVADMHDDVRNVIAVAKAYYPEYSKAFKLLERLEEKWRKYWKPDEVVQNWWEKLTPSQWSHLVDEVSHKAPHAIIQTEAGARLLVTPCLTDIYQRALKG